MASSSNVTLKETANAKDYRCNGENEVDTTDSECETGSEINELNSFYRTLLDLVPSSLFFDADTSQKISSHRHKQDGLLSNEAHIHKRNSKRSKFDPEVPSTTSELQKILPTLPDVDTNEGVPENKPKNKTATKRANGLISTPNTLFVTVVNSDDDKDDDETERESGKSKKKRRKSQKEDLEIKSAIHSESSEDRSGETSGSELLQNRPNPDDLREKLRERIAELQAKRQKGMTAEEFLESKRLRRKESKLKLKQKRKEAKKLKLSIEKQKKNSESKMNGVSEVEPGLNKNNSNRIVFSKFQFSEQARKPKESKQKKAKSYKELYMKVTHRFLFALTRPQNTYTKHSHKIRPQNTSIKQPQNTSTKHSHKTQSQNTVTKRRCVDFYDTSR